MPRPHRKKQNPSPSPSDAGGEALARPRPLNNLVSLRLEMTALYREARAGRIELGDATRLVYILMQIKAVLESSDMEKRMAELEEQIRAWQSRAPASLGSLGPVA